MITDPKVGMRVRYVSERKGLSPWNNQLGYIIGVYKYDVEVKFDKSIKGFISWMCVTENLQPGSLSPEEEAVYQEQRLDQQRRKNHAEKYL